VQGLKPPRTRLGRSRSDSVVCGGFCSIISPLGTSVHEHPLLAPILSEATRAALAADVANRAISMPMRREVRRLIEADVQAWARRARITEDAPPTVVEG
jgi:hypothetical protein